MINAANCSRKGVNNKRMSSTKTSVIHRRQNLQLMTWNVHDMRLKDEGLKSASADFLKAVDGSDILCLQETKEQVKFANYRCFNSNRPKSRSGGVCIAVKNDIRAGVTNVNTKDCCDIIAIKLKKSYFAMTRDIVIINVYDAPTNSSYKKSRNEELSTLDQVSKIISKIPADTGIILLGDFNARTGTLHAQNIDHFDPESDVNAEIDNPQLPLRSSRDIKLNSNGKPFINFIKDNGLAILNGRSLGDVFGEMTCFKYNGCSVVDYVCSSHNTLHNIKSLKVSELSFLSDHCPIKATLEVDCKRGFMTSTTMPPQSDAPRSYKWRSDGTSSTSFKKAQADNDIASDINKMSNSEILDNENLHKFNDDLINIYHKIANKALSQAKPNKRTNKKKWFDWSCRKAKRDLNKAAKAMSTKSHDEAARVLYHQKKKAYKRLIKSKKSAFLFDINKKIESGSSLNWKTFKQLKDYHKDDNSNKFPKQAYNWLKQ